MTDMLLIGVGSELRGDDGAGRDVVAAVAEHALPGVEIVSQIQLTPELAPRMADRDVVVVDAATDTTTVRVADVPVVADLAATRLTHHLAPDRLVAAAAALGWAPRTATVVSVPGADFGFGAHRSPLTRAAIPEAVRIVVERCSTPGDRIPVSAHRSARGTITA